MLKPVVFPVSASTFFSILGNSLPVCLLINISLPVFGSILIIIPLLFDSSFLISSLKVLKNME